MSGSSTCGVRSGQFQDAFNPLFVSKPFEIKDQLKGCRYSVLFGVPDELFRIGQIWVRAGCGSSEAGNQAVFVASTNPQVKFMNRLVNTILRNPDYIPLYDTLEEVKAAIRTNDFNPQALPKKLKSDHELALFILLHHRHYFEHFDQELKDDEVFMLSLMQIDPTVLGVPEEGKPLDKQKIFLGRKLRDNLDFMLKMLPLAPRACRVASKRLRDLKEFMKPALNGDKHAYRHAGPTLIDDMDFMLTAFEKDKKEFVAKALFALRKDGNLSAFMGEKIRKDLCFMLALLEEDPEAYRLAHPDLSSNEGFVVPLVQKLPAAYEWVSPTTRGSRAVREALGIKD